MSMVLPKISATSAKWLLSKFFRQKKCDCVSEMG
jgi:hypothetical protein